MSDTDTVEQTEAPKQESSRYRTLPLIGNAWLGMAASASVLVSIYVIFGVGNELDSYVPLETEYFYFMIAVLLPLPFLIYPTENADGGWVSWFDILLPALALSIPATMGVQLSGIAPDFGTTGNLAMLIVMTILFALPYALRKSDRHRVPIFDVILAALAFGVPGYFTLQGGEILDVGWEYDAPEHAKYLAFVLWALVMEATRRAGGNAIFVICLIVSIYPIYTDYAPGFLEGIPVASEVTIGFHMFGTESMLGIPMNAFANLVVGFLVFGVALQYTGGGAFFLNLAFALLGKRRGGPAKVAIFASGLMGSMSGSVITNVLTTGVMSIPAMKRVGFRPAYAGGVEACASTGGVLMPPVMGATAFVMATFLEISYAEIIIAAAFPSILYYLGLFMQIDAYAARNGLKGLPAEELPPVSQVLREGWYFVFVFVMLIVMLLYMQREAQAPYYATAVLLVINQISKVHRWGIKDAWKFIEGIGLLFAELMAVLAGVGLIIGALTLTGKVGSLTYELVDLAGDSVLMLLLMGAVTSFILGIGMTVTAAYLFLAVTLAPALTQGGLDKLAVHLFMMYWGMISFITPPVAIGAYAAASVAKADPLRTGLEAMRLGSIIYFVPFFFVLNPALIGQGSTMEVVTVFGMTVIGITLISAGLQGHMFFIGSLDGNGLAWPARIALIIAGGLLAFPGSDITGLTNMQLNLTALVVFVVGVGLSYGGRRKLQPG
ncbi:MAG: TRAP transporter fused permease subunit [Pseudomonadota bacterium]